MFFLYPFMSIILIVNKIKEYRGALEENNYFCYEKYIFSTS